MMGIRSWLAGRPVAPSNQNFVEPTPAEPEAPPLQDEARKIQQDFVQSLMALGRANAQARSLLAKQTLLNVTGKTGHATHRP